MEIIAKKILTHYIVEISFEEYWGALSNLVKYANGYSDKLYRYDMHDNKAFLKFAEEHKEGVTLEVARGLFENYLVSDIAHLVVRYIAISNGYDMEHYGLYDPHIKLIRATFQRNGSHL